MARRKKGGFTFILVAILAVLTFAVFLGYIRLPLKAENLFRDTARAVLGYKTVSEIEGFAKKTKQSIDGFISGSGASDFSSGSGVAKSDVVEGLEIPGRVKGHQVVDQKYYTICWNSDFKVADWVAYVITRENLNKSVASRTEDFREDPKVLTSPTLSDFRGSGYDRGHLYSAASAKYSEEAMSSTFLLTNMSMQNHRFNAGLFLKAEDAERDAARWFGTLYAVSGPVLTTGPYEYKGDGVVVPTEFYKALLGMDKGGNFFAIAMVLPQDYQNGNLKPYLLTVDELEYLTGLDFFPALDDDIENLVEGSYDLTRWPDVFKK